MLSWQDQEHPNVLFIVGLSAGYSKALLVLQNGPKLAMPMIQWHCVSKYPTYFKEVKTKFYLENSAAQHTTCMIICLIIMNICVQIGNDYQNTNIQQN